MTHEGWRKLSECYLYSTHAQKFLKGIGNFFQKVSHIIYNESAATLKKGAAAFHIFNLSCRQPHYRLRRFLYEINPSAPANATASTAIVTVSAVAGAESAAAAASSAGPAESTAACADASLPATL